MRTFLPRLMATITRHPRYRVQAGVDFEWSAKLWTHNVFRLFETIFGCAYGKGGIGDTIATSMKTLMWEDENGLHTTQVAFSWEASVALIEVYIRESIASLKPKPFKIFIPSVMTTAGFPIPASPFLFAIALDVADNMSSQSQANSMTIAHTCTGSNLILFVESATSANTNDITGMTYNSAAMSFVDTGLQNIDSSTVTLYLKTGPSTGTNNAVISSSTAHIFRAAAASYTGAKQTSQPDSHAGTNGTVSGGATVNTSTTVVASNCWLYAITSNDQAEPTAVGTTVRRGTSSGGGWGVFDSNGTVGTGSQAIQWSVVGTGVLYSTAVCSFAPFVASSANGNFLPFM